MVADNLMYNNLVSNVSESGRGLDPLRRRLYQNFLTDRFVLMRDAGVELRSADARLLQDITHVVDEFQPTKIVHLSAIASAVEARYNPGLCFDLQLITLRNVLEICRARKNMEVMFLSSSTVYGDFDTATVDENVRPRPRGMYANTKYIGERLVRTYADQHGVAIVIIRPSALYGERCVSGRVSQKFVENALTGKPCLLEGGGDGRLDFTHVDDLTDGMARALGLPKPPPYTNTFNLTFGNARTIAELAAVLRSVIPNVILEERPRSEDKPVRGTLSVERARNHLGFVPKWDLETGYRRYCEWYVEQWDRAKRQIAAN
jgi:nucleoside-diphosphate-sugar epimerase